MRGLAVLQLQSLPELEEIPGLPSCSALRAIAVSTCPNVRKLDLGGLIRLENLEIRGCERLQVVVGATNLAALTCLVVAGCLQLSEDQEVEGAAARHSLVQVRLSTWHDAAAAHLVP
jgi:hypothetical protein